MAKRWLSFLRPKAAQVKLETQNAANTALRVGQLLEDLADTMVAEFDPASAYLAGQWVIFEGTLAKTVSDTTAGQSPASHKAKWVRYIVTDPAQIVEGNYSPVSAHALQQALSTFEPDNIAAPVASETQAGVLTVGTEEEITEGVRDDVAVSPKKLKNYFIGFYEGFVKPTLKSILATPDGNVGEDNLILKDTPGKPVNLFLQRGEVSHFKGLSVLEADGIASAGSLGLDTDDAWKFILSGILQVIISTDEFAIAQQSLTAPNTHGKFGRLSLSALNRASESDYVQHIGAVANPQTGRHDLVTSTDAGLMARLQKFLDHDDILQRVLARINQPVVIDGDRRKINAVYCFNQVAESAEVNDQYIPITHEMIGTPQPHMLNRAGAGIARRLERIDPSDSDIREPAGYIKISFPNQTTYLLTALEPVDTDFLGELELRRKSPVLGAISQAGQRFVIALDRHPIAELAPSQASGQAQDQVYYKIGVGLQPPAINSLYEPLANGLERYTGLFSELGTDCGLSAPPPVVTGAPVFYPQNFSLPQLLPGAFDWKIPPGGVLTGDNSAEELFDTSPLHPWFRVAMQADGFYHATGTVPTGADYPTYPVLYGLTARQADGKTTDHIITLLPVTTQTQVPLILFWLQANEGTNRKLVFRAGGDFGTGNFPLISFYAPGGVALLSRVQMNRYVTTLAIYEAVGGINLAPGQYSVVLEDPAGSRKLYGSISFNHSSQPETAVELSATPPSSSIQLVAADYAYAYNNPPSVLSRLDLTVKSNGGSGTLEWAYEVIGPSSAYVVPKTNYLSFSTGDYGNGYSLYSSVHGIAGGSITKIYIRRVGTTQDVSFVLQAFPTSGTVSRRKTYPAPALSFGPAYQSQPAN